MTFAGITTILLGIFLYSAVPAIAQSVTNDKVDEAVKRGVDFLLSKQKPDGSISDDRYQTAMTSLAIMAMCAPGHTPAEKSREGEALKKALEFVLRDDRVEKGYFGERDHSRMYGHGIVSVMLAEVIGMGVDKDQDYRVRERLNKAMEVMFWSQERKNPSSKDQYGGWRYQPKDTDSDLSITIWQVMAMRAAKNAGISVPRTVVDKAVDYIKRCYKSERDEKGMPKNLKSGCGYQPGWEPHYATAAAGLRALQVCGEYDAPETKGSADWLREHKVKHDEKYFYYGTYYFSQAMYQQGGDHAREARLFVENMLLEKQKPDGSWQSDDGQEREAGLTYSTSMALLSLSVKYHFLPLFER
jgi:hypothetical protein